MGNPGRLRILLAFLILILSDQFSFQADITKAKVKGEQLTQDPFLSPPEKIHFKHLTRENGLSDNFIWWVLKDNKGFMWFATSDGLSRYDGRKFKVFRHSMNDPYSLGANEARALCEDKLGRLWVGTTGGGICRYNPEQENFTQYINPNDTSALANSILTMLTDKSGVLWIGTHHGGLHSFDPETEQFTSYTNIAGDSTSLSHNMIWTIKEDSQGNLWIGTVGGGLNKFNRETKRFTRYLPDPHNPASLSHSHVPGIFEDKTGTIWLGTYGGGISKLTFEGDENTPVFKNFKYDPDHSGGISGNKIDFLYIDENDIMWFGTAEGGLNRTVSPLCDNRPLSFISYEHDPYDPFSLLGNSIPFIFKDNSDLFWIASSGIGLNIYNTREKPFRQFKHEPGNPSSLKGERVTSIFEGRSGTIWIGTWNGGLNKWDRKSNRFIHYLHDPKDPNSLSEDQVVTVSEDRQGFIWVGTYSGGLNKFDMKTEEFYRYKNDPLDPGSISDITFKSITEDKSGRLWVGTGNTGFNIFDREKNNFANQFNDPDRLKILGSNLYTSMFLVDDDGVFWISDKRGGVIAYDHQKDELVHYQHDPDNSNSLSSNTISIVYRDKSGIYWIGTMNGGLNRYDRTNNQFKRYSMNDGLPSDWITEILEDDSSNLWIGTKNGLSKFNPQEETFRNYDVQDGLLSNEIMSGCRCKTGELIFSNGEGFIIFQPDSIKDNTHIPPVYITDFYLSNKPVAIGYDSLSNRTIMSKSIIECEKIELNYDDKIFSFEFASLDFHAPVKNKYAYRMEGFDKDWTYVDANYQLITYTNLDPGNYTFRVKGSNNDGYWNQAGASLKIIIHPPWWQTGWAYLFYVLLIGGAVYFTWRAQLKRIRIRHEFEMSRFEAKKMHEVDEMKSRFFTNISHEFRTPLTLILGPVKQIMDRMEDRKTRDDLRLVHKNAGRLLGLVNQLLDISRLEAGSMKLQTSPRNIVPLVKALTLSFTSYAERKRISLTFHSTAEEIMVYLDRDKMEKILTNILSNAFKFTPDGGRIEVSLRVRPPDGRSNLKMPDEIASSFVSRRTPGNDWFHDGGIDICITDTGIGIPADKLPHIFDRFYQVDGSHTREQEGTGIGLSLTKELVELHKGKIEVESTEGKGTTFTVSFPLGKDHLQPEEIGQTEEVKEQKLMPPLYNVDLDKKVEKKISLEIYEKGSLPLLLIVEDNSDVRNYIRDNLHSDYQILEAPDGEDGWQQSVAHLPDLIISDVMMPKLDGFQLCGKLKSDERTSHIPVILLTAKAAKEDRLTGYDSGADAYIMKPFEPDELRTRIRNLITQRQRLHQHFQQQGMFGLDQAEITSIDKKFLQKAQDIILQNISDEGFSVARFAEKCAVSRSLLHKKLVALTGEPPRELIRRIRLRKAAELIEKQSGNLSQIALEVGFTNPAYFSEAFKKQFGVAPSQYQRDHKTS